MPLTSQYEAFLSLVAYILINWPHQNYANKIDSVPRFHHKNEHAMQPSFQPVCHLVLFVCLFVLSCCFLVTLLINYCFFFQGTSTPSSQSKSALSEVAADRLGVRHKLSAKCYICHHQCIRPLMFQNTCNPA